MAHFWSSTASLVFSLILIINDTVKTETDSPATTEIESLLLQPWQEDLYEGELDKHPYCRCLSDGLQGWIVECDCGRDFPGILNFSFPAKLPYKTAAVRIKNCDMVEISKGDILRGQPYVPLEVLSITSIVLLKLHPGLVMDSNLILISQIVNIKAIPKGILGQTVEHFIIRSATVTTVEKGAFDHADFLKNFGLHNTKIWYIDGEILKVNAPDAIIYISNTSLGELNNARMDLLGKSVTLVKNKFGVLQKNALRVNAEVYYVEDNEFSVVAKHGFDLSGETALIVKNHFELLQEDALLIRTAGTLIFSDNSFKKLGHNFLIPSFSEFVTVNNRFLNCSRSNIEWIWDAAFNGTKKTKEFYSQLLDRKGENECRVNGMLDVKLRHCYIGKMVEIYKSGSPLSQRFANATARRICQFLNYNSSGSLESGSILLLSVFLINLVKSFA